LRRLILFFLIPCCFFLQAQDNDKFLLQQFNTENGLPSNGIKGLQWDPVTGFLWIATEAGIVRYNGLELKTFSKEDDSSITNERILFLVKNNKDRIYSSDFSGNIYLIDKNRLAFVNRVEYRGKINNNQIGYAVSDALVKSPLINPALNPFTLRFDQVYPDGDTAAFILHGGQLFRFRSGFPEPVKVFQPAVEFETGFVSHGLIFMQTPGGTLYLFDRRTRNLDPVKTDPQIRNILKGKTGYSFFWENGMKFPVILFRNQAWKLNYQENLLTAELITDQVPENILIRYVQYDDKRGTLFLGTDSRGLLVLSRQRIVSVKKGNSGNSERTSYYSQIELPSGDILTNEGHILPGKNTGRDQLPIQGKFLPNILLQGDSLVWYMQLNRKYEITCLHSFNRKTHVTTAFPKIRIGEQTVLLSHNNRLYVCSATGLKYLQGDSLVYLYKNPPTSAPGMHYDIASLNDQEFAIATCNSLLRYNLATRLLDTIFNTGNYCVRTLWRYKDYLFVGTYGDGLMIYKNGKIRKLPLDKNNYLLYTHCFVSDESGFCWISTNRGLFMAKLDDLTAAFENNTSYVYYHYFGHRDGMEMTELNGGCTPCAITLKNKIISFPTMDGLIWVNPADIQPALTERGIYIDAFVADSIRYEPDSLGDKVLPASTSEILIRPGISAWCNHENIYLDYTLNENNGWKPVDMVNDRGIRLTNLKPGLYRLKIRKLNGFGTGNYSLKELSFRIKTPWHQTGVFYISVFLLIGALILVIVRVRTRQLKMKQEQLEKLVTEKTRELKEKTEVLEKSDHIKTRLISIISHDIVTPLKFLTSAGKNLMAKRTQMPESLQEETIREMANTSQELQLLSTNILNWIKFQNEDRRLTKENVNIHELVKQVFGILQSLARQKGIKLVNQTDPDLFVYQYAEPLKILLYNLVTNSINFSDNGSIRIGSSRDEKYINIVVKDEGVGMSQEEIRNLTRGQITITAASIDRKKGHGLGYLIIKDLLKMMDASLKIRSEPGKGTKVTLLLPVGQETENAE